MATDISSQDIQHLLEVADVVGFTGQYTELGGGEGNDTFALECQKTRLILRVARYSEVNNLANEARALDLLNSEQAPKLIYFDTSQRIRGRAWILESHLSGGSAERLDQKQLKNLGELLAEVHSVKSNDVFELKFWSEFLETNKHFGDEEAFLNHPDDTIKRLINRARDYFQSQKLYAAQPSLIHGDLSLNNILVRNSTVSLIDWEFARFTDPMSDFSTIFYEDMAYNKGQWRIHITADEKAALFTGYTRAGGVLSEQRLKAWHNFDKLGGAIYLYWKLNQSGHAVIPAQSIQYREDLDELSSSLERNL